MPPVPLITIDPNSFEKIKSIGTSTPLESIIIHPFESLTYNSYLPGPGLKFTELLNEFIVVTPKEVSNGKYLHVRE